MNRTLLFTLFLCALIMNNRVQAQDVRSQLRQIANDLAKQIEAKGKKRVVIASFLDLKNQETELGRYMADKFSIGMSTASSLEITDRSQLAQLLRDNKLAAERILDPRTIPSLGKITGAEVIITGNYTALDNSVDITVKAIELERGLRLAVAEGTIPRTSEINKLLNEIDQPSYVDNSGDGSPLSSNTLKNSLEGNWVLTEAVGCEDWTGMIIQVKTNRAIIVSVPDKVVHAFKGTVIIDNIITRDPTNFMSERVSVFNYNGTISYVKAIYKLIDGGKEFIAVYPNGGVAYPNQKWRRMLK